MRRAAMKERSSNGASPANFTSRALVNGEALLSRVTLAVIVEYHSGL